MSPRSTHRAIIRVTTTGKRDSRVNYSRRMYAIIRKYTPDVAEGNTNECFADLTGLRTFFKMTYAEIAEKIREDVTQELGITCTLRIATTDAYEQARHTSKKERSVSTYKEINSLFSGRTSARRAVHTRTNFKKLSVPFIGKVS